MVFVSDLKTDVAGMLEGFKKDDSTRADAVMTRAEAVKAQLMGYREDMAGARRAWAGIATATSKKPVSQPKPVIAPVVAAIVVPPTPPVTVKAVPEVVAVEAETPAEPGPDDLMRISGIGNSMRDRLNRGGIFSFEQLASTNSKDLLELLGARFAQLDVGRWIVQAKGLAEE